MNYQALAYGFMALTAVMLLLYIWQRRELLAHRNYKQVTQRTFITMQEIDRWFASYPTLLLLPAFVWRHSGAESLFGNPFADLDEQFKGVDNPPNLNQGLSGFREDVVKQLHVLARNTANSTPGMNSKLDVFDFEWAALERLLQASRQLREQNDYKLELSELNLIRYVLTNTATDPKSTFTIVRETLNDEATRVVRICHVAGNGKTSVVMGDPLPVENGHCEEAQQFVNEFTYKLEPGLHEKVADEVIARLGPMFQPATEVQLDARVQYAPVGTQESAIRESLEEMQKRFVDPLRTKISGNWCVITGDESNRQILTQNCGFMPVGEVRYGDLFLTGNQEIAFAVAATVNSSHVFTSFSTVLWVTETTFRGMQR